MTVALLVPIKDLSDAKHRLAPLLTEEERTALARLMLEGVLGECARLPPEVRRVVVTNDRPAIALARERGFDVIEETRQDSESDSVDRASAALEAEGMRGVLRVPLDLPFLRAAELMEILSLAAEGLQCVLVPSRDGTGTNGLYRAPPTLFPSRFGPNSLALHQSSARERTGGVKVVELASLALDIDEPGDVAALLAEKGDCAAKTYLEEIGVRERLERS
jgi:2-phospho-L-lactate guanylyltransferase